MLRVPAMLMLLFTSVAIADEAYFVELEEYRKWPAVAQQAYVLGVVDQALFDSYQYDRKAYDVIVRCMEKVNTEAMFQAVHKHTLEKFDESLILLIGDGIYEFCEKSGYPLE